MRPQISQFYFSGYENSHVINSEYSTQLTSRSFGMRRCALTWEAIRRKKKIERKHIHYIQMHKSPDLSIFVCASPRLVNSSMR